MASVPNLPVAPATTPPGSPAPPEGAPPEFFAQLIGGPAIAVVVGPVSTPAGATPEADGDAAAPQGEEAAATDAAPADIIPLLQAQSGFPVTLVAPPPAATSSVVPAQTAKAVPTKPGAPVPELAIETSAPDPDAPPVAKPVGDAVKAAIATVAQKVAAEARPVSAAPVGRAERSRAATANAAASFATPLAVRSVSSQADISAIQSSVVPSAAPPSAVVATSAPIEQAARAPAADAAALSLEHDLDLANDAEWLDRLARDIARAGANDGPMRFRLHPQTLGHLQVEIAQSERGATVRMTVETEAARNILVDAQPRLAAEARAQGVRLAGTEVDLGSAGQQQGDPRRQADARDGEIVRVVGTANQTQSGPGRARSDRYA